MKTSSKLLLSATCFVIVLVVVLVILSRFFVEIDTGGELTESSSHVQVSGESTTQEYDISDFNEVKVSGSWEVIIKQADSYLVRIETPTAMADTVIVKKYKGMLRIGSNIRTGRRTGKIKAEITLPYLSEIDSSGSTRIDFSGFKIDALELNTSGASHINGRGNTINKLSLACSGSSKIQLKKSPVTHAGFNLSGSSSVELTMMGGQLSGRSSGSSRVAYAGEAKLGTINLSGSAYIEGE